MIRRYWWLAGLAVAVVVVVVLAPLASSDPDGLERVAIDAGFAEQGTDASFQILPDYSVPFLGEGPLSLVAAGLIGVVLVFAAVWLLGRLLAHRSRPTD
jgi:cobalt/nickel transport system permease protein